MKKSYIFGLSLGCMSVVNFAQAQTIYVVDPQKVFISLPGYKEAEKDLENLQKALEAEMNKKIAEIEGKVKNYQDKYGADFNKMSEAEKAEIKAMSDELTKLQKDHETRRDTRRKALVTPLKNKYDAAIKELVNKKGDPEAIVLDVRYAEYFSPKMDITEELIKKLSSAAPRAAVSVSKK